MSHRAEGNPDHAALQDERRRLVIKLLHRSGAMRLMDVADALNEPSAVVSGAVAMLWRMGAVSICGTGDLTLIEPVHSARAAVR